MNRRLGALGLAVLGLVATSAAAAAPVAGSSTLLLGKPGSRLSGQVFSGAALSAHPRLIVVLHGDAPGEPPSYQYVFAHRLADRAPDTVVLALLRPGYRDPAGRSSEGRKGLTTGDNYTPEVLSAVAVAVEEARRKYAPHEVVLVGHSGGAVLSADLMALQPGLADRAVLVSCPCDVKRWRSRMAGQQSNPVWLLPVRSVSPMDRVSSLPRTSRIDLIVGEDDPVAPPPLSRAYAEAARPRVAEVSLTVLPKLGHEILLDPRVLDLAARP